MKRYRTSVYINGEPRNTGNDAFSDYYENDTDALAGIAADLRAAFNPSMTITLTLVSEGKVTADIRKAQ